MIKCALCEGCHNETARHLFFECSYVQSVWSQMGSLMHEPKTVKQTWLNGIGVTVPQQAWLNGIGP